MGMGRGIYTQQIEGEVFMVAMAFIGPGTDTLSASQACRRL